MFLKFLFRKNEVANKQHSSQIRLSRSGRGIRRYEKIRKHEEEEKEKTSEKEEAIIRKHEEEEKEEAICSEAEVTVTRRRTRRFFKLSRRTSSSRRRRISSIAEMGHRLSGATDLLSRLKVSWRRFTKALKNSRPHLAAVLAVLGDSQLILNLHPPPPAYYHNHHEEVKGPKT